MDIYYSLVLKWPYSPISWGTFCPDKMSDVVWWPNTIIYISLTKYKKEIELFMLVSLCATCLWRCFAYLLTTVYDMKQGNQRSLLEGRDSWRLHRQRDWFRTAICPKIRPNVRLLCMCIVINFCSKQTIMHIRTNCSAFDLLDGSSYLQLHWIVSLIPILQGGLENVPCSWRTFPLTDLQTSCG